MKIKNCRSCNSINLEKIISLGDLYLSDFVKTKRKLKKFPLTLFLCKKCFLLQLNFNTPTKYLYTERYGYRSGINQTMRNELSEIVKESLKIVGKNNKITVLDIGANDGTLLGNYPSNTFRIAVEPIKKFEKFSRKKSNIVINDFFNFNSYFKKLGGKKADIITAISCFYDMEEPNQFIEDIKKILKNDGILVIQQNYLVEMLRQNAFDNIVHEHLEYYSLLSLNNLLNKHDLEVFDVKLSSLNGGSFRTYIAWKGQKKIKKSVRELVKKEKKLKLERKKIYKDFAKRIEKNKNLLVNFIKKVVKKNKTVYIYGASTRGNTLIQYYGLNNKLIKYAVERNKEKWGKRIASINVPIISEEKARKNQPDYMLVLPWFFKNEFMEREKEYLRKGGHLIFPLPEVEVF